MSLLQTLPINILLSALAVFGSIYMLFEAIRQKGIAAKLFFISFFIFCLGLDSTWFASSSSTEKLITKFTLIISGSLFLLIPILAYVFGDYQEKEKAKNMAIVLFMVLLMSLVILGSLYLLFWSFSF